MIVVSVAGLMAGVVASCGSGPTIDADFPPGDPVVADQGDNPVVGNDDPAPLPASGADDAGDDDTNYGLLTVLAACLIGAGVILVGLERWARRRTDSP